MAFRLVALEDHIKTKCFFCFCFTFIAFKICLLSIIRLFKFLSIFIHLFLKIVHRVQWAGVSALESDCSVWQLPSSADLDKWLNCPGPASFMYRIWMVMMVPTFSVPVRIKPGGDAAAWITIKLVVSSAQWSQCPQVQKIWCYLGYFP